MGSLRTLKHKKIEVPDAVETRYEMLKAEWRLAAHQYRSMDEAKSTPIYQDFLLLGLPVIGLMLKDLEIDRDFLMSVQHDKHVLQNYPWFGAIQELTVGHPKIPSKHEGQLNLIIEDYLRWGRSKGYL